MLFCVFYFTGRNNWNFENIGQFISQFEKAFGNFEGDGSKCYVDEPTTLIGNKLYERDMRECGRTLVTRACDIVKRQMSKMKSFPDRNEHPMNVIIGSPGAGKTTLAHKSYEYILNQFQEDIRNDEMIGELASMDKAFAVKNKQAICALFAKIMGISFSYHPAGEFHAREIDRWMVNESMGTNKWGGDAAADDVSMNKKNNSGDNDNSNNKKDKVKEFEINTAFLWRILYHMLSQPNCSFGDYCNKLKEYGNSQQLSVEIVLNLLDNYKGYVKILIIDEISAFHTRDSNGNAIRDDRIIRSVFHTASVLTGSNQFIHVILAGTAWKAALNYESDSGRPLVPLSHNLFSDELLTNLFAEPLQQCGVQDRRRLLALISDTMGLPRLVRYLLKSISNAKEMDEVEFKFSQLTDGYFGLVPKRSLSFMIKLLSQREKIRNKNDAVEEKVCDDTWDDLESNGFIKIENDGVYVSRLLVMKMAGNDCQDLKYLIKKGYDLIFGYEPDKSFEALYIVNEQLLSLFFDGETMPVGAYYNVPVTSISHKLQNCTINVKQLTPTSEIPGCFYVSEQKCTQDSDWKQIKKQNTVHHFSNKDHPAIETWISREINYDNKKRDGSFVVQNKDHSDSEAKEDDLALVRLIDNEISKEIGKHSEETQAEWKERVFIAVIAVRNGNYNSGIIGGNVDIAMQAKRVRHGKKANVVECEEIKLYDTNLRRFFLPIFRRICLFALDILDTQ